MKSNRTFYYGIGLMFIASLLLLNVVVRQKLGYTTSIGFISVCMYAALASVVGGGILMAYSHWQWSNEPRKFLAKP